MCPGLYFVLLQEFPLRVLSPGSIHMHTCCTCGLPSYTCMSIILTQMLLPGLGTRSPRTLQFKFISLSVPSNLHPSRLHLATYQMKKRRHRAVRQVLNP